MPWPSAARRRNAAGARGRSHRINGELAAGVRMRALTMAYHSRGNKGSPGGGTGRRNGLKIRRSQGHAGSIPARGTNSRRDHAERLRAAPVARRSPRAARRELRGTAGTMRAAHRQERRRQDHAAARDRRACSIRRRARFPGAARRRVGARDEFHAELAYLGHEPPLKGDLSGRENLRYSIGIRRAGHARRNSMPRWSAPVRRHSPTGRCACCPRASGAAWRWRACCSPAPRCGCSMSPPPISMPTGNSWWRADRGTAGRAVASWWPPYTISCSFSRTGS